MMMMIIVTQDKKKNNVIVQSHPQLYPIYSKEQKNKTRGEEKNIET